MALAKKTIDESMKPVTPLDMAKEGYAAKRMSEKIQEQFGNKNQPVVGVNQFQGGATLSPAKEAEFKRRSEFVPEAYKTAQAAEERQTKAQDELADFYAKWDIQADELAMKQSQALRAADLQAKLQSQEVDNKLKEIGFSAFKNDADRQDSLEKAYLDGNASKQLITASINGAVKMQDIDTYWKEVINDFDQRLMDVKSWADADLKAFEYNMKTDAVNWGSIVSGLTTLSKVGVDAMDTPDDSGLTGWDKVKSLFTSDTSTTPVVENAADAFLNTPDSEFLEE